MFPIALGPHIIHSQQAPPHARCQISINYKSKAQGIVTHTSGPMASGDRVCDTLTSQKILQCVTEESRPEEPSWASGLKPTSGWV